MIKRGDIVKINMYIDIEKEHIKNPYSLKRTPSVYHFGNTLVLEPSAKTTYTVTNGDAKNGFLVVDTNNHSLPIGFCILYIDDQPYVRITQVGHEPEKVTIQVVGFDDNPPLRHKIGSQLYLASHEDE